MPQTYSIPQTDLFLHPHLLGWLVRDQDESLDWDKLELVAQVRSGEYFELLATRLDYISKVLATHDPGAYELLEATINDLLYLQKKNYQITKK